MYDSVCVCMKITHIFLYKKYVLLPYIHCNHQLIHNIVIYMFVVIACVINTSAIVTYLNTLK